MLQSTVLPLLNVLEGHESAVTHVAFTKNGEMLVTADVNHDVVVWKRGEELYRLNFRSLVERFWGIDRVRSLAIDDERRMLYVAAGGRLHALDLDSGERKWIYAPPFALCFMVTSPVSMIVRDDGNLVAVFDDGFMEMWTPQGQRLFRFSDNDMPTKLIQVHRDDAVIGTDGFSVTIWDPETQAKVGKLNTGERIFGFAGPGNDHLCATRTYDSVTIWGLESGSRLAHVTVGVGMPLMAFLPAKKLLAVSEEHRVRLYDYTGVLVAECQLEEEHRTVCLTASHDGTVVAVGLEDGSVRLFDVTVAR